MSVRMAQLRWIAVAWGILAQASLAVEPESAKSLPVPPAAERAVQAGTNDFVSKPVNKLELLSRVKTMFRVMDLEDENERLRRYIEEMEKGRPKQ